MNFRPTKAKVIISVIIEVIWIVLVVFVMLNAGKICVQNCGSFWSQFTVFADCGCLTFTQLVSQWLFILAPGVLVYLTRSLIEKKADN